MGDFRTSRRDGGAQLSANFFKVFESPGLRSGMAGWTSARCETHPDRLCKKPPVGVDSPDP